MASREFDLDHIFTYHPPSEEDRKAYGAIRDAAANFAATVLANTPSGADQSDALRKIREAVMTANAAVALKGRLHKGPHPLSHEAILGIPSKETSQTRYERAISGHGMTFVRVTAPDGTELKSMYAAEVPSYDKLLKHIGDYVRAMRKDSVKDPFTEDDFFQWRLLSVEARQPTGFISINAVQ